MIRLLIFCVSIAAALVFPFSFGLQDQSVRAMTFEDARHETTCAECLKFATIQPEKFFIGSNARDSQIGPDESPAVAVTIADAFAISVTQVTRAQFALFVVESGYRTEAGCWTHTVKGWIDDESASWRSPGFDQTDNDPVVCVSRDDALAYIDWLSNREDKHFRLPSEAEWHIASGAHLENPFWGTKYDLCDYANVPDLTSKNKNAKAGEPCNDGALYTSPVASYLPNPYGLFDVIGNAWEWTADCWLGSYNGLPNNGSPLIKKDCLEYTLRGHSWTDAPGPIRLQTRYSLSPVDRQSIVSFRIVLELPESK